MTISIWRYSHLTLAISSFIFILTASVTGIILAFEPISNQLKPYAISNTNKISVAQTLDNLQQEYDEIVTLKISEDKFVIASVIDKNGKSGTFYINPTTGKKISNIQDKLPIYKFATNLHRSLFLKSTGRFLVAFFSFLLLLIAITGVLLIAKRQGGFSKFFNKVINEDFKQFWHVVLGKYTLIPIIIITLTGVYLSLEKFSLLPKTNIKHTINFENLSVEDRTDIINFNIFKNTTLADLKFIEFPFSDDDEDYFFLKLHDKELIIHQFTGEIISSEQLPWVKILSDWSLFLHTGRGTILWSIVLMLSCFAILFFIYSGFAITLERRKKSSIPKNKYNKDNAEFIILVGSETGGTFEMATSFFKGLLDVKKTVFIDSLNNYTFYKKATHLLILTSTYGEGEPPINAKKFKELFLKFKPRKPLQFSVVGFGSLAYPDYCQFAIEVDELLSKNVFFKQTTSLCKINNQSFVDFKNWSIEWSNKVGVSLDLKQELKKPPKQHNFNVVEKTEINIDDTFIIRLQPTKKQKFTSGDLLAITPRKDNVTRLYSIGRIDNDIVLSIKKHELGVCSNLLYDLQEDDLLKANIQQNKEFHFTNSTTRFNRFLKSSNSYKTPIILIANGTGIGPFLGMLHKNSESTNLFWGARTKESFEIYQPYLQNLNPKKIHIAYSQGRERQYVQDLLANQQVLITSTLKKGGCIMICGSIAMMNGVLYQLENICKKHLNKPLDSFKKQIKTDCY